MPPSKKRQSATSSQARGAPPKRKTPNPPDGVAPPSHKFPSDERLERLERALAEYKLEYTQALQTVLSAQAEMQARFENMHREMLSSFRDLATPINPQNAPIYDITDEGL